MPTQAGVRIWGESDGNHVQLRTRSPEDRRHMALPTQRGAMKFDWTKSEFDWTEILDVEPSFRTIKIAYRLVRASAKTVISRRSTEIVLKQVRPNREKFHTRVVLRGFVFCTFLPNWISRHFPVRGVRIQYSNGHIDILVKGLAANFRVEECEEVNQCEHDKKT